MTLERVDPSLRPRVSIPGQFAAFLGVFLGLFALYSFCEYTDFKHYWPVVSNMKVVVFMQMTLIINKRSKRKSE